MLDSDKRPITNIFQTYCQILFKDVSHLQTKILADTAFDIDSDNNFMIQLVIENVTNIGTDLLYPTVLTGLTISNGKGNISPVFNIPFGSYKVVSVNIVYGVAEDVYELGVSDIMKQTYLQVPSVNLQDRLSGMLPAF